MTIRRILAVLLTAVALLAFAAPAANAGPGGHPTTTNSERWCC